MKSSAGRFDLKEEAVSLAHIVKECRRLLGLRVKKRHITIEKPVFAKSSWSNAIKFTPEGGLIKIRIGWTSNGGQ